MGFEGIKSFEGLVGFEGLVNFEGLIFTKIRFLGFTQIHENTQYTIHEYTCKTFVSMLYTIHVTCY